MSVISSENLLIMYVVSRLLAMIFGILIALVSPNIIFFISRKMPGITGFKNKDKPPRRPLYLWIILMIIIILNVYIEAKADTAISSNELLGTQTMMSGDYRIVVLPFTMSDQISEKSLGKEVSLDVYHHLIQNITLSDAPQLISIWGPIELEENYILNSNDIIGDQNIIARSIAEKINADLVIYGKIYIEGEKYFFEPKFYVNSNDFYKAQDIVGEYSFGTAININTYDTVKDRIALNVKFANRIDALSQIILGLSYYSIDDFPKAQSEFLLAENLAEWEDIEGKQVLYLLIADTFLQQDNFDLSEDYLLKSIAIEDSMARSWVGLGNVYYRRALLPYENSNDPKDLDLLLLNKSIDALNYAIALPNQPVEADIPVKVHFEFGNIYLVLYYTGYIDEYDNAISEFQYVIDSYNNGDNQRIRERVAVSYARIGLIYRNNGQFELARENYLEAVNLLDESSDLRDEFLEIAQNISDIQLEGIE